MRPQARASAPCWSRRGDGAELRARASIVVNATGTWSRPFVPWVPGRDRFAGRQLHTVDYRGARDFRGLRTLVVGGGLSAVQFLLELAPVARTIWATRRPPNFTPVPFDAAWGQAVESAVRERTARGLAPASVVRTTGIPMRPEYLRAVRAGVLVSHGMVERIAPGGARAALPGRPGTGAQRRGGVDGGGCADRQGSGARGPAPPGPRLTGVWVA